MKAIALNIQTQKLSIEEIPEPKIQKETEVKLKMLEVGICGTDREEVAGGRAFPPAGENTLILGHESVAEVVEVGQAVRTFKKGDLAVITVRRGCGSCAPCKSGRSDFCYTGNYTERGIKGRHGFHAEYVIDEEQYLVKVPPELKLYGVLTEPMSVVEKAIDEILTIQQARLPDWRDTTLYKNKKALVAGLGPIGLLACIALRLRGFQLFGMDIVDTGTPRTKILQELGGTYIDARTTKTSDIPTKFGQIDLILEAAGVARVEFDLFSALGINGGYVLTGVPPTSSFEINGGHIVHDFVMKNQVALGSVNAGKNHWEMAVRDLTLATTKWKGSLQALITSHISPDKILEAIEHPGKDEIKTVVNWSAA